MPYSGAGVRPTHQPGAADAPTEQLTTPPLFSRPPRGKRDLPAFLRPPAVWFTGIAAGGIVMIVAIILLTLPPPPPRVVTTHRVATATTIPTEAPTATATALPVPAFALPSFSDWRAAYIAQDGKVHITSLDGQSDITGPALPINTTGTTNSTISLGGTGSLQSYTSLSVSGNGNYLAYINQPIQQSGSGTAPPSGSLVLYNLAPQLTSTSWTSVTVPLQTMHIGGWSPDNTRVVVTAVDASGIPTTDIIAPNSPQPQLVPGTGNGGALAGTHVVGWLDATHLLMFASSNQATFPPLPGAGASAAPTASPVGAVSLPGAQADAGIGRSTLADTYALSVSVRRPTTRATLSAGGYGLLLSVDIITGSVYQIAQIPNSAAVALSSDGSQVVAASSCVDGCTSPAQLAEVISTSTGAVHQLPHSDSGIEPIDNFLWQPNGNMIAATTLQSAHPPVLYSVSLVDSQQDAAHPVQNGAIALQWSQDGTVLALGDGNAASSGASGAHVWLVSPGAGTSVSLSEPVVAFIGFVKTA